MNRLLFILFFLGFSAAASSQTGFLFVKKGIKKKRTYEEGERIMLKVKDGTIYNGLITLLLNDTIYLNGRPIPRIDVTDVILGRQKKKFHIDPKEALLITGGAVLVTGGLTLSKQATFKEALTAAVAIGYGPLVLQYLKSKINFKRRKYHIGKKFRLQVLEFHLQKRRAF